jgi:iron-sulfur cluster assembly protein
MAITLTESAAQRIERVLERRGSGVGLRFGVKESGCSGYSYIIEYADDIQGQDIVFESHGVKVIVDNSSLGIVDGTEIDYVRDGLNESFQFSNPRVADACGCGESFAVGS